MAMKTKCLACARRRWCQSHHVVWEQHGGTRDRRNLVPLCLDCHAGYHARSIRIRADQLPEAALDYAFERLGVYAFSYLSRRYDGKDPRLDERLARAEEESERLPGYAEIEPPTK